jgi:hypothetical protein
VTDRKDDGGVQEAGSKRCAECGAPISGKRELCLECRFMPSPWAAAVAVMGMLTLGVLLGSATSQVAQSAGLTSILLEAPAAAPAPLEEPTETTAAQAAAPTPAALPATVSSLPAPTPLEAEPAAEEEPTAPVLPPEIPAEETLPPVKHVFLIALEPSGFEESFGPASPTPYLAQTLTEKGELVPNYYAVAGGDLANQIALLSGQGPTPETASECPTYADVVPGTLASDGQVEGAGCIYPAATPTLPGQLTGKKLSAKAYVEGLAEPCVHEEGRRNPFLYFRALIESPDCVKSDVGLDQLALDLRTAAKTPALSYVVPNPCHDDDAVPCEEGELTGAPAAEDFLRRVVPAIEASPAFKEGGLIAITSTQAPQTDTEPDTSACCVAPEYPNLPAPATAEPTVGPVKPTGGGGKVGLLLISPFVEAGSKEETSYFNHYSLLLTIEELFGLEKVGYANEPALVPFGETVFNAGAVEEAPVRPPAARVTSRSRRR